MSRRPATMGSRVGPRPAHSIRGIDRGGGEDMIPVVDDKGLPGGDALDRRLQFGDDTLPAHGHRRTHGFTMSSHLYLHTRTRP